MILDVLRDIVTEKTRLNVEKAVIMNYLKEYLQYLVLEYIYNSKDYNTFVFTGGSCLRICFGGSRLSEDLDFDLPAETWKKFNVDKFAEDISLVLRDKYLLPITTKTQSDFRIYLKFPILKELGLAGKMQSDYLFVKVEPNQMTFPELSVEVNSISKFGYNFTARNYKKEFLMIGKIGAILERVWFKGDKNEIDIKGRDFYDLYWYLQSGIEPNYEYLKLKIGINSRMELKEKIWAVINEKVTEQKLSFDLKKFFPEQVFVENFCKNYKELISKYL
ncbi:MAG: hypothetical protein A3J93_00990 [Candidatus Magasanikbacteria bacterium RIFOXYC2_FULL_42_28]|uniref:Nucleotidyl transferase AbiEii/AbiGii toxin family protein n=1 Tax=Candidatus Magasanikbacteria bacterium RIFOXYC2_FULL_42_28 TaxID=1798704 RepID=A0A1F6NXM3_9BACT|nr:MAG: hypothetical protein A3J93_00990 [Candidatus Magasanikbacteria bacterium RIFOXYC2_FULL_42_28]